MKQPGVAELKAHLSDYLALVKAGNEVLIKERGLPIAKIVPLETSQKRKPRIARLINAGLLLPGRGRIRRSFFPVPKPHTAGPTLLQAVLDEREENR